MLNRFKILFYVLSLELQLKLSIHIRDIFRNSEKIKISSFRRVHRKKKLILMLREGILKIRMNSTPTDLTLAKEV